MTRHLFNAAATLMAVVLAAAANAQSTDSFLTGTSSTLGLYPTGAGLNGQNPLLPGWTGAWIEGCCGTPSIIDTGLTYPNLPAAGGAVESDLSNTAGRVGRLLEAPVDSSSTGTLYMSLLMQADVDPSGAFTYGGLELHNNGFDDGANRTLQLVQGENEGDGTSQVFNWQLVASSTGDRVNLGTNDQGVNLFVLRFDLSDSSASDTVSLFQNPDISTPVEPGTADATIMNLDLEFDRTSFARFGDPGVLRFDELRIASTYSDVVTSVFETNLTLGDTNGNGVVEFEPDFGPIRDNWLENTTSMPDLGREDGDLNLDGAVDILDFREWKSEFPGSPAQIAQAFASLGAAGVPEPSSTAIALICGAAALAARVRRF